VSGVTTALRPPVREIAFAIIGLALNGASVCGFTQFVAAAGQPLPPLPARGGGSSGCSI
jgi:hypothetical protein